MLAFVGFNLLMVFWLFGSVNQNAAKMGTMTGAEHTGYAIGTGVGAILILFVWLAGAVILGLLVLFTRPKAT